MKLKIMDSITKKPCANEKVQVQLKGKHNEFISFTTNETGQIQLDDKYAGDQISVSIKGKQSQWTSATDSATLTVALGTGAGTKQGVYETTQNEK